MSNEPSSIGSQTPASSSRKGKRHLARKLRGGPYELAVDHPYLRLFGLRRTKPFRNGSIPGLLRRVDAGVKLPVLIMMADELNLSDGLVVMTVRDFEEVVGDLMLTQIERPKSRPAELAQAEEK